MENPANKALRDLGIFYCAVFVLSLATSSIALWLYWDAWRLDTLVQQIANVSSASIGLALLATIAKEAGSYMVLAAMKIKEWQDEARKEGREEGRKEERKLRLRREEEAFAKFGFEVDGVLVLPRTPEVERFLAGEDVE